MSENGSNPQSLDNLSNLVSEEKLQDLVTKLKSLRDLQNVLENKGDLLKIGVLFEQLKKLPEYLNWINKLEEKLKKQDIDALSNAQVIKLLSLVQRNVENITNLLHELTKPPIQQIQDNRSIVINIDTKKDFEKLPPESRDKIRKVFDAVIEDLESEDAQSQENN
jgi:predicted RND superfamily exporter protein